MKKLILALSLILVAGSLSAQTVLFTENFNSGTPGQFTLNTADVSSTTNGYNDWVVNNSYTGGSGTFSCMGFPFVFTIGNNSGQPAGITGSPNSSYMHIRSDAGATSGITNGNFMAADGVCNFDENYFARMTNDISTMGYPSVTLSFWWMCGGGTNIHGEVYYSTNGGLNWTLINVPIAQYKNQTTWTQQTISLPAFANQNTLRIGFRFVNVTSGSATDPGFCIDDVRITAATCNTSSTQNVSACGQYVSPSGSYTYTASGTYKDTIPNIAGCDSIITLNVTIKNHSSSSINASACGSYTSPSGNHTYTASGVYLDTIPNSEGCDSIITINLTIKQNSSSSINVVACFSYKSPSGQHTWTTSGVYLDTLANSAGCDSIITINLTINTVNTGVSVNSTTLTANATGAQYQWLDCNNNFAVIPGASSQSYNATANGSYAVAVTENGCTDTSACQNITSVGILSWNLSESIKVYPNPTKDFVEIYTGTYQGEFKILLHDLSGRTIYEGNHRNANTIRIDLRETSGMLILEMFNNGKPMRPVKIITE